MDLEIRAALISVFNKDGLEPVVHALHTLGITIYSTGGTQTFIESLGIPCTAVEQVTGYPSILGGRVKTLHPKVFGGILARRDLPEDRQQVQEYEIPCFDLVIIDLYPFAETVANTTDEAAIIEKIDIGGVSLIRAAAKNFKDVVVIASSSSYPELLHILSKEKGITTGAQRRLFAALAFAECAHYDVAIAGYFNHASPTSPNEQFLRYGENPHQQATFTGNLNDLFEKLNGKELSFNNLVDIDAACSLLAEFDKQTIFAIIKHTNVCGIAERGNVLDAWEAAFAGDPDSAFGGVLITNAVLTEEVAQSIHEHFFEVLIAPAFEEAALNILKERKNRILLQQKRPLVHTHQTKTVLNGTLTQSIDDCNYAEWTETGARPSSETEKADLIFANIVCKHLKSNAITLVKNRQLIGKGCGQTSRIDALRQAIDKANLNEFDLQGAVMGSDAFFPFSDCLSMANEVGITAAIEPGGSIRDNDSVSFAQAHNMALVMTQTRHFRH